MLIASWLMGCAGREPPAQIQAEVSEPRSVPAGPDGAELFGRTWLPLDPRVPGGDGLGPVANATSCTACHNQGGPGGAGGTHVNVGPTGSRVRTASIFGSAFEGSIGRGFGTSLAFFGGSPERSTPALFGAGAIDGIAEGELLVLEALGVPGRPEITGRVGRDAEGRVTRFGWKGQTASLAAFVENACANELGLETAAVRQPGPVAPGLDMDDAELAALVGYVASLPAPVALQTPGVEEGQAVFVKVGCEGCHREQVGSVEGLYSDLLLHDLGPDLSDAVVEYYGPPRKAVKGPGAKDQEWRTTPLWGLRDSAPYLHDGRADTLANAIRQHGGEARKIVLEWAALSYEDKGRLESFLFSLVAPSPAPPRGV